MKLKDIVYIFSMLKGSSLSKPDLADCLPPKITFNLREEKKQHWKKILKLEH
jgi:hypothetical protein